jgi:exosome complex RNA-binding protein Rrp42 (RNase PH superfamily)
MRIPSISNARCKIHDVFEWRVLVQIPLMEADSESGDLRAVQREGADVAKPFKVTCTPRCLTAGLRGGQHIVDLTADEEQIVKSKVTVVAKDATTLLGKLRELFCHARAQKCTHGSLLS